MVRLVVFAAAALLVACASTEAPPDGPGTPIDAPVIDATDALVIDATDAAIDAVDALPLDACVAGPERCNGMDDDCDLQIDEDFPTLGGACSAGAGQCARAGVLVCDGAGTGVTCDAVPGTPVTETCNGADDDCDLATDEGFGVGTACDGADADQCAEGMVACTVAGTTTCSDNTGDNIETCNAVDDDCDTATDEGFNLGAACDGPDGDACIEGVRVCHPSGAAVCSDATSTTIETCNGLDDDCRNGADDGFNVGTACTVGVGLCQRTGVNQCNAAGTGVQCSVTPGAPTAETCGDGIDQDCSGADVTCPVNDRPASPLNISAGGTFTVDLSTANNDQDFSGTSCGSTGGRDVYYTFTLPAPEVVYLDTFGSNFDTTLRVFNGPCSSLGALASCFDDSCSILQTQGVLSLAGGTYCVVADQFSSGSTLGALVLNFTRGGRTGTLLSLTSGTVTGTTCASTDVAAPGCQANDGPEVGYYFTVCPSTTRTVNASTCAAATTYDSVVYLRRGSVTSGDLACDDDSCGTPALASILPATSITGPGLFWILVDGYNATCGPYSLTYSN